jgi:hypothetical protein
MYKLSNLKALIAIFSIVPLALALSSCNIEDEMMRVIKENTGVDERKSADASKKRSEIPVVTPYDSSSISIDTPDEVKDPPSGRLPEPPNNIQDQPSSITPIIPSCTLIPDRTIVQIPNSTNSTVITIRLTLESENSVAPWRIAGASTSSTFRDITVTVENGRTVSSSGNWNQGNTVSATVTSPSGHTATCTTPQIRFLVVSGGGFILAPG